MQKKFTQLVAAYSKAVEEYCKEMGWDYYKFRSSISDEGISHPDLYLEDPNEGIVERLSQFLEPTNQSSIFIIWDDVGMGKSSLRDFVSRSLDDIPTYYTILIHDPRVTAFQMLKIIAGEIDINPVPNERLELKNIMRARVTELAEKGLTTIVWIDEAEKITKDILSELRALSDIKTASGSKTCKIVLSGTPTLIKKIEKYIEKDPEDAAAFDDRTSLNVFKLHRWTSENIYNYWKLLADYCGGANPFDDGCAEVVLELSDGKPRTIAQISKLAIHKKAIKNFFEVSLEGPKIKKEDILDAMKDHIEDISGEES